MEYTNFLLKLSPNPPEFGAGPPAAPYQAQVLHPATATGGRFGLALTAADIAWLRDLAADLREFAREGAAPAQ